MLNIQKTARPKSTFKLDECALGKERRNTKNGNDYGRIKTIFQHIAQDIPGHTHICLTCGCRRTTKVGIYMCI